MHSFKSLVLKLVFEYPYLLLELILLIFEMSQNLIGVYDLLNNIEIISLCSFLLVIFVEQFFMNCLVVKCKYLLIFFSLLNLNLNIICLCLHIIYVIFQPHVCGLLIVDIVRKLLVVRVKLALVKFDMQTFSDGFLVANTSKQALFLLVKRFYFQLHFFHSATKRADVHGQNFDSIFGPCQSASRRGSYCLNS